MTKWTFDFDLKVKIFKRGLSHSVFRIHSNFGIRFFVQDSEIVQTIQIPKSWLLDKSWPKSQNFQGLVFPYFLRRLWFWGLFLHLRIQNCSNSVILQLLALMWTLTKNQDVWAKIVLFRFSHRLWLWNPLICFWLGNHLCDPLLQSTSSIQNLSSQDQNLRFIHLVWIPSRLSSRLYQGFPFKVQMISHKCVLNLKLHWITSSTYLLIRCLPVSNLPFPFDAYRSQPLVSPKILNHHSQLPIYLSSSLDYK